ncbi:MAG: alginate export family protein [Planctomycetota bacterium]
MKTRNCMTLLILFLVVVVTAGSVYGRGDVPVGPNYHNLRYEEDFSYLGGEPGTYQKDAWDPLKWIGLGDDWHLTLGGQARLRFESEQNKAFGSIEPSQDAFLLQRYFLHGDLRYSDWLRFFLQGKFAHVNDRDRNVGLAGLEDHADIHQAFADITALIMENRVTFRLGRQELQYGNQRLISPLDWGNTRRTFDGIKVFTEIERWRLDAFAVRPVLGDRRNLDDEDENVDFYGLYSTYKGTKELAADFYCLLLKDNNIAANSNGDTGRRTLYTPGTRLWGTCGNWDYETELAGQFGTFAGDRARAWMATAGGGYTFSDCTWQPRLGLLYDYASGDSNPSDGTHETFNQHFPLGHAWLGYLDVVGRSNIHAIKAQLKVKPSKKITAWADFHTFFADQDNDALYSAGGAPTRRLAAGTGSQTIGHELDLAMEVVLDVHTTAFLGHSYMWPGGFIDATGDSDSPSLFYAQIEYKF